MRPRSAVLTLWSAALLGCSTLLFVGLLPRSPLSGALLGQLGWLALVGSVPTALILGAATQAGKSGAAVVFGAALAVALLGIAIGWSHTEFLLSGPGWARHPQHGLLRVVLDLLIGLVSAGGWLWLVAGLASESRALRAPWVAISIAVVAGLTFVASRYRAYDYSMAQLVFPGGVLLAAVIHLLGKASGHSRSLVWLASLLTIGTLGTRLDGDLVATGEREVIAHSRAGSLVTLYVLPHLRASSRPAEEALACSPPLPAVETSKLPFDATKRRSVIIVSVDALRSDVIGTHPNARALTPELSRFEKKAISYVNATTTYPATLFAVGSAFTGLSPAELYLSPALPETVFTQSRGRVDRQIVVLPDVSWFRLPIVSELLARGVELSFARNDASASQMLIEELRGARRDGESVMAWIHYYAPHDPYQTHEGFSFGRGRRNAYLSEVAYFDRQLGALVRYLERDGWLEDSLVVFFSDHGEALGERSYYGHHVYLDDWMIDVPLMLAHRDLAPGAARVGASVADIAPTILHFLGLPQASDSTARSLLALGRDQRGRASFAEAFPVRGRALFDSFRLPALDEASIRERLRSIRIASKGYEPKVAVRIDDAELIHHRSAHASFVKSRTGAELSEGESSELEDALRRFEQAQLRRIECRLRLSERTRPSADPR